MGDEGRPLIGLDLGGTKVYGVVLEGDTVRAEAKRKTPFEGGPEAIVATMAKVVSDLGGADGVGGIGVGAPGAVDHDAGVLRHAPNLPGFGGEVPLAPMLAEVTGARVALDNDATVAVLAEARLGAGRDVRDLVAIWCGTGVGGGIVLGGEVHRGPTGLAGEIGHMVVQLDGRQCGCGKPGHLEAYAGRGAMEAVARERAKAGKKNALVKLAGQGRMTSSVFVKAVEAGDRVAIQLIDEATTALGAAVATVVAVLDVGLVIVGGGLANKLGLPFLEAIRRAADARMFPGVKRYQVVPGAFGDRAGAVGAALMAGGA